MGTRCVRLVKQGYIIVVPPADRSRCSALEKVAKSLVLTVFSCFSQHFCLHFEAFQFGMTPVYMGFLSFIGVENDARKYNYSLEVRANGRKLIWEGTPRSIRDSHLKVGDSHDGKRNMALFFSGGDRKEQQNQ